MRVTLWADALEPNPGGIGRYTWELCKGVHRHGIDAQFFARNQVIADPAALLRGDPLPRRRGFFRKLVDKRRLKTDLIHGPNYFLPPFAERGIITVHDLSVFRFPETHPAARVTAFERDFLRSLERASMVITDTETVRRELIDTFSLKPEMVTTVPLGVDPSYQPRTAIDVKPKLQPLGLTPGRYGLCVSTIEPRKKISELLAAWRRMPRSLRDRYPLVLCGGTGWRNETLRAEISAAVGEGWLTYLGYVDESLLPYLYAGAALFVYPSIYEGFGLPPVEAMASGIPVVVADRSCLPEVCGPVARYIDPDDPESFDAALDAGLCDDAWRAASSRTGIDRASTFPWSKCVQETARLYRELG